MKGWTLWLFLALGATVSARQFYVDQNHSLAGDGNPGTDINRPWRTIGKAAATLVAGDTVSVRAGTYNEAVVPANSGTASNRITYQRYGDEKVIITKDFNILKNHITVKGFEFSGACIMFGFQVAGGSYCRILDNYIHHSGSCGLFLHGTHNLVRGNLICNNGNGSTWGPQITMGWGVDGSFCVIEYNEIHNTENTGQDFIQYLGHDIIIRHNYFHHLTEVGTHNDCYQDLGGVNNIWFLGNRFEYLDGVTYFVTENAPDYDHVWRHNLFWGRIGWGFNGTAQRMRIINNTFGSAGGGYGYSGAGYVRNNIYNDWSGQKYNCPYGADDGDYNLVYPLPLETACTRGTHDVWGVDPKFVDFSGHDFHLQGTSPCIDAGTFPTVTTSAGSGTQVPVADARIFVDGFGIVDGDSVQLQGETQAARITSINYAANVLTVDRSLTWTNGQGVSTPYHGTAPDLGRYEYGNATPYGSFAATPVAGLPIWSGLPFPNPVRWEQLFDYMRRDKNILLFTVAGQAVDTGSTKNNGSYLMKNLKSGTFGKIIILN